MKILTYSALVLALLAMPALSQAEWSPRRSFSNNNCRYASQRYKNYGQFRRAANSVRYFDHLGYQQRQQQGVLNSDWFSSKRLWRQRLIRRNTQNRNWGYRW